MLQTPGRVARKRDEFSIQDGPAQRDCHVFGALSRADRMRQDAPKQITPYPFRIIAFYEALQCLCGGRSVAFIAETCIGFAVRFVKAISCPDYRPPANPVTVPTRNMPPASSPHPAAIPAKRHRKQGPRRRPPVAQRHRVPLSRSAQILAAARKAPRRPARCPPRPPPAARIRPAASARPDPATLETATPAARPRPTSAASA